MPVVDFEVNSSGMGHWIAVDDHDINLEDGQHASVDLPSGEHVLAAAIFGAPGNALSVTGRVDGQVVVKIEKAVIQPRRHSRVVSEHFDV